MSEDSWRVPVQQYASPIEAEIACAFLREHDVDARVILPQQAATTVGLMVATSLCHVLVPESQLETAREALVALESQSEASHQETEQHDLYESPYRGGRQLRERGGTKNELLGMLLPFGLGQWYAKHRVSGFIVTLASVVLFGSAITEESRVVWMMALVLYAIDAYQVRYAVRDWNQGIVADTRSQLMRSLGAVLLATIVGPLIGKLFE